MATTISENSLNEIAQWIDDIGSQLYAKVQELNKLQRQLNSLKSIKVHELYELQNQLNTLQSMIEDYRDDPEGRFR
jgi:flagellar biosynthesis chaperone FliJ